MKELPVLVNYNNIECVIFLFLFFFFTIITICMKRLYMYFFAINWAIRNGEGRDM